MRARLVALTLLVPSVARADPPKKESTFAEAPRWSVPLLFGVDAAIQPTETSTGFFVGWRPEVIFAWTKKYATSPLGFGVGPYAEIVGSTGTSQIWLGGGASAVLYWGHLGVALSGGLDCDWLHAEPNASPVVGLFVGYRAPEVGGVDLPFGVRVDFRPAVGDLPATVIVAAQLDLAAGFMMLVVEAITHGLRN